jgi:hypothetical protein
MMRWLGSTVSSSAAPPNSRSDLDDEELRIKLPPSVQPAMTGDTAPDGRPGPIR